MVLNIKNYAPDSAVAIHNQDFTIVISREGKDVKIVVQEHGKKLKRITLGKK